MSDISDITREEIDNHFKDHDKLFEEFTIFGGRTNELELKRKFDFFNQTQSSVNLRSSEDPEKKKMRMANHQEIMNLYQDISDSKEPTQELLNRILQVNEPEHKEKLFEILICKKYHRKEINRDGNSLFVSIENGLMEENPHSLYLIYEYIKKYPDDFKNSISASLHVCLRTITAHYIFRHPQKFLNFISEEDVIKHIEDRSTLNNPDNRVLEYAKKMNKPGIWAGETEIHALLSTFKKVGMKRSIKVFDVNNPPTIEEGEFKTPNHLNWHTNKKDFCITLLRTHQNHYHLLIKKRADILFEGIERDVAMPNSKEKEKEKEKEN